MRAHPLRIMIATAAVTVVLAASAALAAPYGLRGSVLGNGGAAPATGSGMRLYGTVGQAAVGQSAGGAFRLCHGFWCFGGSRVLAVDLGGDPVGNGAEIPTELSFDAPVPTPSRGEVRFALALPWSAEVSLIVYDVSGRQVGDPVTQHLEPGHYRLTWNAGAEHAGVYFGMLAVDGRIHATRRITLVR